MREVFSPRTILFTQIDGNDEYEWRVILLDIQEHARIIYLDTDEAQDLLHFLHSGKQAIRRYDDNGVDIVIAPTSNNPPEWYVQEQRYTRWKRRLGKPVVNLQDSTL
jgi:hypothetical protein